MFCCNRESQPKTSEDMAQQIFEKGRRIEQEFAEYFTGKTVVLLINH